MVDLSKCKKGDILISKYGKVLQFLEHTPEEYYDCTVEYVYPYNLGKGSRNYDGSVFKQDSDEDIVKVYHERFLKVVEIKEYGTKKDFKTFKGRKVKTEHYDSPGLFIGISDDGHDYVYWIIHDNGEVIGHSPLEKIELFK